jgi:hypothetical protein
MNLKELIVTQYSPHHFFVRLSLRLAFPDGGGDVHLFSSGAEMAGEVNKPSGGSFGLCGHSLGKKAGSVFAAATVIRSIVSP